MKPKTFNANSSTAWLRNLEQKEIYRQRKISEEARRRRDARHKIDAQADFDLFINDCKEVWEK